MLRQAQAAVEQARQQLAIAQQPTKDRLKGAAAAIEKSCAKLKKLDQ